MENKTDNTEYMDYMRESATLMEKAAQFKAHANEAKASGDFLAHTVAELGISAILERVDEIQSFLDQYEPGSVALTESETEEAGELIMRMLFAYAMYQD